MASINRVTKTPFRTHEGAPASRIGIVDQLERSVMSCLLWEDTFYENGEKIANRIADLCAKAPINEVARIAIQAKEDMRLRHVPLLVARELVRRKDGRKVFASVAERVFLRPDDICEFLAIYWKDSKDEPLAKQVKKAVGNAFRRFDEYQLAKYNGGQKAIKLRDAMRILRPIPVDKTQSKLWKRLVKGGLKTPDTWEVEISQSKDKKKSWTRLLKEEKLGGMAMLRNIRNMTQAGVSEAAIRRGVKAIDAGRLLPINFITAANYNAQYEPEIENKFLECFGKKEKMKGKTIIMVDVSGSMDDKLAGRSELSRVDVACSLVMIGRELFEDCRVFTFSDSLVEIPARRGFALRDSIMRSQVHSGTRLGDSVRQIVKNFSFDRFIVISDEQSRDSVPNIKGAYMINVASNEHGVGYGDWLHIDGWSDKVLDYIALHERGMEKELRPKRFFANDVFNSSVRKKRGDGVKLKSAKHPIKKLVKKKPVKKTLRKIKSKTKRR